MATRSSEVYHEELNLLIHYSHWNDPGDYETPPDWGVEIDKVTRDKVNVTDLIDPDTMTRLEEFATNNQFNH